MRRSLLSFVLSATLIATLGACVPDPALVEAGLAKPPESEVAAGVYASTMDGSIAIPAVPVDKVPTQFQRQTVAYQTDQAPGTIVIDPTAKHLFLVTGKNKAVRYGIGVGRAGFEWSGEALVTDRKPWPTWTPPAEMIARSPELAKYKNGQPGGLTNPLGARALYLTTNGVDYGYRIHGTPEWNTIGTNASSGCIRMINQDVMDLYNRVPEGAKVIVLTANGQMPKGLTLPPHPEKKKVAATSATPAPAVAEAPATPASFTPPPLPPMLPMPPAVIVPPPA